MVADQHLYRAAEYFNKEADTLYSAHQFLWWEAPEGPDKERNKTVYDILGEACNQYHQGIKEIETALSYF
jgi:hypothetical protein